MKAVDKFLLRSLFPLCLAASFAACQKVDLPVEEGGDKTSSGQTGNKPGNNGPNLGEGDSLAAGVLTVNKLLEKYEGADLEEDYGEMVAGYIVGAVDSKKGTSSLGLSNVLFVIDEIAEAGIKANLLIADKKGETDISRCVPVELSDMKEKEEVNLVDNPGNFGRRIGLVGLVKTYYGEIGLRNVEYYQWLPDGGDEPEPAPDPVEPEPGPDNPNLNEGDSLAAGVLTVTKLLEKYEGADLEEDYGEMVAGYIVGAVDSKKGTSSLGLSNVLFVIDEIAEAGIKANLLIADKKGETDISRCVPVELSDMKEKEEVNLVDNPGNFGRRIGLIGLVKTYYGEVGLRNVVYYQWLSDGGDEPEPAPDPVEPDPDPVEPDPGPDNPNPEPNPDPERKDTIRVDTVPGHIEGGRSNKNNW